MVRRKDRPATSTVLPGYRDVAEIGGGAFATVYRAVESDTGRPVALKILRVDSIHRHLTETFAQEVHALAQVSDHPNIVTLYRPLTTPDGRPALVLELCRGSLAEQLRQSGPLDAASVTSIGIKIAGALETAHRHGFLHRDMKPQNILVTQFGEPALGDFGVAALQASAQATAGVFGFTTLHAAPEILEGRRLSPATDVYGLASTMYQLLTGLAPFATFDNEAPASVILRIIRDPVQPLQSADIPISLSDLLESALAKEADARPGSAAAFAQALVAIEAAAGWSPTAYVAWGDDTLAPAGAVAAAASPAPEGPPSVAVPASRPARAPSVAVPDVAHARPVVPAGEVAATVLPAAPAPLRPPAEPFLDRTSGLTAGPSPAAGVPPLPATIAPSSGGPPPLPPALPSPERRGPSVARPDPQASQVVWPGPAGPRAASVPPAPTNGPTQAPVHPPIGAAAAASTEPSRPVFIDPPAPAGYQDVAATDSRPGTASAESRYEQTILPSAGTLAGPSRRESDADRPQLTASPLMVAGMVAAFGVVLAAILLIVGVL